MTLIEATEDAVRTIRYWQNRGVLVADVARDLRCARDWESVRDRIVIALLMDDAAFTALAA